MVTVRNYEWDYERQGRTAFAMAGPAGTVRATPFTTGLLYQLVIVLGRPQHIRRAFPHASII